MDLEGRESMEEGRWETEEGETSWGGVSEFWGWGWPPKPTPDLILSSDLGHFI